VIGILGETIGWRYGFGVAGVGMTLGLVVLMMFRGELQGVGEPPVPAALKARTAIGLPLEWTLYLGAALCVLASWYLVG